MSDVTRILSELENGDPSSSDKLLPLVYEELRKLAVARLGNEKSGQTLQATALVHEVYLDCSIRGGTTSTRVHGAPEHCSRVGCGHNGLSALFRNGIGSRNSDHTVLRSSEGDSSRAIGIVSDGKDGGEHDRPRTWLGNWFCCSLPDVVSATFKR